MLILTFLILLFVVLLFRFPKNAEAATLLGPSDFITSDTPSEIDVVHNIGFLVPTAGHTIVPTDYIRIILPNFIDVTGPLSITGIGGAPVFGVTGNVAYVTNVTANPNTGIGISGITATNPASPADFDITIEIANDMSGSIVYDSVTFEATILKGVSTVSVVIPSTSSSLELAGFTSPGAFVTILLDTAVAGTTTADSNGNFYKLLTGLTGGTHNIDIHAEDVLTRTTQTTSFSVDLFLNTTTTLNNIAIPSTINAHPTTMFERGPITLSGLSHPLSQITVFMQGTSLYSDVVVANSLGEWSYTFDSRFNTLNTGLNYVYAREVVVGGYISDFTQNFYFTVNSCLRADVNCDSYVNLVDFSIMLYYWMQSYPTNFRADINDDFVVNLTDFSIMLFYWTG